MIELAERMAQVHSDIRGPLFREAMAMQAQGIVQLKQQHPGSMSRGVFHAYERAAADAAAPESIEFRISP